MFLLRHFKLDNIRTKSETTHLLGLREAVNVCRERKSFFAVFGNFANSSAADINGLRVVLLVLDYQRISRLVVEIYERERNDTIR